METNFGAESGIVHFWNEEDAAAAEQAMVCVDSPLSNTYVTSYIRMQHCAEVGDRNIAVVIFQQPRRTPGGSVPQDQFNPNPSAPAFVPAGMPVTYPVSASHCHDERV